MEASLTSNDQMFIYHLIQLQNIINIKVNLKQYSHKPIIINVDI